MASNLEQAILDGMRQRGIGVEATLIERVLGRCAGMDPHLIEDHFRRVRSLDKYVRDFSAEQIAEHLQLLGALSEQELVAVAVHPGEELDGFQIVVAGVDVVGVTACFTACLADMGLLITGMEVVTYEPVAEPEPKAHGTSQPTNRYVLCFAVRAQDQVQGADGLAQELRARLKAAYWHLMRGDVRQACKAADQDELVGRVLDNRFRLDRRLTQGGMGTVYLATQLDLDRPVIIKLLRDDFTGDRDLADSFLREARVMAQAHSPHVVYVYAAGVADERCWMALEYMTGGDVGHWITRHGTPSVDLAARWLRDALAGLRYIHQDLGLVHCDLKPHNLLLDAGQNLKIGDLGLSQFWRLAHLLGSDGSVKGTPWYMSPEQARGELLDERSDLFSLGSTFFHILTGTPPFQASSCAELLAKVSRAECESIEEMTPDVSAPLAVIVRRLMAADPLQRYQEASVALADLETYLRRNLVGQRTTTTTPALAEPRASRRFAAVEVQPVTVAQHETR